MASGGNIFNAMLQEFDGAARLLGLDPGIWKILTHPKRQITVSCPIQMDNGEIEDLTERWLTVADRQTPTVRAVMLLDMDTAAHEVIAYSSRAPGKSDDAFRHLFLYQLMKDLVLDEEPKSQLRHLHRNHGEQSYLLSYWQREIDSHRSGALYDLVAPHPVGRFLRSGQLPPRCRPLWKPNIDWISPCGSSTCPIWTIYCTAIWGRPFATRGAPLVS